MATKIHTPVDADELTITAAFVLPLPQVLWIANESQRLAAESGKKPNKSEVVRSAIERAMRESDTEPQELAS